MIEGQRGCGVKYNKRKAPNKRNTKRPATNHQQDGWMDGNTMEAPKSKISGKKNHNSSENEQRRSMKMMGGRDVSSFFTAF